MVFVVGLFWSGDNVVLCIVMWFLVVVWCWSFVECRMVCVCDWLVVLIFFEFNNVWWMLVVGFVCLGIVMFSLFVIFFVFYIVILFMLVGFGLFIIYIGLCLI